MMLYSSQRPPASTRSQSKFQSPLSLPQTSKCLVHLSPSHTSIIFRLLEKSQLSDPAKVKFELQDFFALDPPSSEKFDLIFDHT